MQVQTAARMSRCALCWSPDPLQEVTFTARGGGSPSTAALVHWASLKLHQQHLPKGSALKPPPHRAPGTPRWIWHTLLLLALKHALKKAMYLLTPAANPGCMSTASSPFLDRVIPRARGKQIYLWQSLKCKSLMPPTLDPKPSPSCALQGPCSDLQAISRGAKLAPWRQRTNLLLVWPCFSSATWQLTRHRDCRDKVILSVDLAFRHP